MTETISPAASTPKMPAIQWRQYTMFIALIFIWGLFYTLDSSGTFLSARNFSNLVKQMSVTAVLAMGMFMILVDLNIDLSLGSLVGLTGGVCALLIAKTGAGAVSAVIGTLLVGLFCGSVCGMLVNSGVPSFIASLGGMLAYRGAVMGLTRGESVPVSDPWLKFLGSAYLPETLGIAVGVVAAVAVVIRALTSRSERVRFGFPVPSWPMQAGQLVLSVAAIGGFVAVMQAYKGIPVLFAVVIVLALVLQFVSARTRFGRQVFAIGGNKEAARLSGIPIQSRTLQTFQISGVMAAIAGILLVSRLGTATTDAGTSMELDAVASCVIGGTSLLGGEGTILGAVLGAMVMASIDNGMSMLNTEAYWQLIVKGSILVIAVFVDIRSRRPARG